MLGLGAMLFRRKLYNLGLSISPSIVPATFLGSEAEDMLPWSHGPRGDILGPDPVKLSGPFALLAPRMHC